MVASSFIVVVFESSPRMTMIEQQKGYVIIATMTGEGEHKGPGSRRGGGDIACIKRGEGHGRRRQCRSPRLVECVPMATMLDRAACGQSTSSPTRRRRTCTAAPSAQYSARSAAAAVLFPAANGSVKIEFVSHRWRMARCRGHSRSHGRSTSATHFLTLHPSRVPGSFPAPQVAIATCWAHSSPPWPFQ